MPIFLLVAALGAVGGAATAITVTKAEDRFANIAIMGVIGFIVYKKFLS
jgi:uncharacterized membrane protein